MHGQLNKSIKEKLRDKAYRDAYVESHIEVGIPHQIRALREQKDRDWSQAELGRRCGKPANVISRLEDPEYGSHTIRTLLQIASACDVALLVKFVSFGSFLEEFENVSPQALEVPSFPNDPYFSGVYQAQQVSACIIRPEPAKDLVNSTVFVPNTGQHILFCGTSSLATPNVIYPTRITGLEGAKYAQTEKINIPSILPFHPTGYPNFYSGAFRTNWEQRTSAD